MSCLEFHAEARRRRGLLSGRDRGASARLLSIHDFKNLEWSGDEISALRSAPPRAAPAVAGDAHRSAPPRETRLHRSIGSDTPNDVRVARYEISAREIRRRAIEAHRSIIAGRSHTRHVGVSRRRIETFSPTSNVETLCEIVAQVHTELSSDSCASCLVDPANRAQTIHRLQRKKTYRFPLARTCEQYHSSVIQQDVVAGKPHPDDVCVSRRGDHPQFPPVEVPLMTCR